METNEFSVDIRHQLRAAGHEGSSVSVFRLRELQSDYRQLLEERSLDDDFYREIVSRYGLHWDFEASAKLPAARSVIIAAVQQPKISLEFEYEGKKYYGIIPPNYVHDTDDVVRDVLAGHLGKHGYTVCDALLPAKLLAVRSGLARYGRNNIAYIDGWGSYFRLRVFFSDAPCAEDQWREPQAMELCDKCTACVKKCPTNAIGTDRFLIDAGKCLTFLNEGHEDFPKWIDPRWHNCLIGCMVCQDVCPANKDHTSWLMPGEEFHEEETRMILECVSHDSLPKKTSEKLGKVGMLDDCELLKRNLRVLIDKERGG